MYNDHQHPKHVACSELTHNGCLAWLISLLPVSLEKEKRPWDSLSSHFYFYFFLSLSLPPPSKNRYYACMTCIICTCLRFLFCIHFSVCAFLHFTYMPCLTQVLAFVYFTSHLCMLFLEFLDYCSKHFDGFGFHFYFSRKENCNSKFQEKAEY